MYRWLTRVTPISKYSFASKRIVDCTGLSPAEVLCCLVNGSLPVGYGILNQHGFTLFTMEDADKLLQTENPPFFDYVQGKRLKINFGYFPHIDMTRYGGGESDVANVTALIERVKKFKGQFEAI